MGLAAGFGIVPRVVTVVDVNVDVLAYRQNVAPPVLQRSAEQLAFDVRQFFALQRVQEVLLHGISERVAVREPVRFFSFERVDDGQDARRFPAAFAILGAIPPAVWSRASAAGIVLLLRRSVLLLVVEDALGVYPLPRRDGCGPNERRHAVAIERLGL